MEDLDISRYCVFYKIPRDQEFSSIEDTADYAIDYVVFYAENEEHAIEKFEARYVGFEIIDVTG